jgi:hypothetical protein
MNTVIIKKTSSEYWNIFIWLFENIKGNWETQKHGECTLYAKSNDEWFRHVEDILKTKQIQGNFVHHIYGAFVFEDKNDAVQFKLIWG